MDKIVRATWVLVKDGKALCVRTRGLQSFYYPGGKVLPGESDADALEREVYEELGVRIVRGSIVSLHQLTGPGFDNGAGKTVVVKLFSADYEGVLKPSNEIEEMKWMGASDLPAVPELAGDVCKWLLDQKLIAA